MRQTMYTIFIPICILITTSVFAQTPIADGGLKIGNTIPDEVWNMPLKVVKHSEGKETITLAEYRDKLIILDFWGTLCGACISSLYKLDTLQSLLPNQLAVIPVAAEQEAEPVLKVIEKTGWNLPSVVSALDLKAYFPHKMIPQYVWIKDNEVRGITSSADVTVENIHEVLKNKDFSLQSKNDIMDYSRGVNLSVYADQVNSPIYLSSVVTGKILGIPSSFNMHMNNNGYHTVNFTNVLVISMYQRALETRNNRIIFQSNDSIRYGQIVDISNMYGYQLKLPEAASKDRLRLQIINDLNTAFQLQLDSQVMEMDCLVVTDIDSVSNENTTVEWDAEDSIFALEYEMGKVVSLLNYSHYWTAEQPIYIDESAFDGKIKIPGYETLKKDAELLKAILFPHGLTVKKAKRPVMMYILTDVAGESKH